jgi:hypothetical protein
VLVTTVEVVTAVVEVTSVVVVDDLAAAGLLADPVVSGWSDSPPGDVREM